jgi:hypothetical protein
MRRRQSIGNGYISVSVASIAIAGAVLAGLVVYSVAAHSVSERALANSLATDTTRDTAVASVVAAKQAKVALLLSWTRKRPDHVTACGLYTGLADAFGQLKTQEAIPFLIKNIALHRSCVDLAPWLKAPVVTEWALPSVGALIRIGPNASRAVMAAFDAMSVEEERRAALFVVSRISGVPEARGFLESVSARAGRERYWSDVGVKALDANQHGQ